MKGNFLTGTQYLALGFNMLKKPKVWPYVAVPLLINLVLFILLSRYFVDQAQQWINIVTDWLPQWLSLLGKLLWLATILLLLLIWVFCFSLVASFIASPFYGKLSSLVQAQHHPSLATPERALWQEVPHAFSRELRKLLYYAPRALLLFIISWIPPFTLIAPFLWFLFAAWMLSIQFADYPADNQHHSLAEMITQMKQQRLTYLGFGSVVSISMMIPVVNLFVMPASVVGATLLYLDLQSTTLPEPFDER